MKSKFHKGRLNKEFDFIGLIISTVIVVAMAAAVIVVLQQFVEKYTAIELYGVPDKAGRTFDLLAVMYLIIIAIGAVFGAIKINETLARSTDFELLMHLPIRFSDILLSKLLMLFIKQFLFLNTLIIPCNLTIGLQTGAQGGFWALSALVSLLLPVFPFLLAVIIALPLRYVTSLIRRSPVATVVTYTALIVGAVVLYSRFLVLLRGMFESGNIKFLLNEQTVRTMSAWANGGYPANLAARLATGQSIGISLLLLILSGIGAVAAIYGISYLVFARAVKKTMSVATGHSSKSMMSGSGVFGSLFKKEFITVFRTPQYTFQYIAVAVTLPLIVYACVTLFSEFVMRLIGMNFNLEICILIISMLSVVTNSFCASNISRDGEMFLKLKTVPIKCKTVIFAKVAFCSVTNGIAIFISCLVVWLVGYVGFSQFLFLLAVMLLLTTGEIMFATRKDLNKPHFDMYHAAGATDSNSVVSVVTGLGLVTAVLMGAVAIGASVLIGRKTGKNPTPYMMLLIAAIAAVYFTGCLLYLKSGLEEKYKLTIG